MEWRFSALLVLIISSCVSDFEMKPVEWYPVVHDNSSKVWLIQEQLKNDTNYSSYTQGMKDVLVFHANRNVYLQRYNLLGNEPGKKGTFYLSADKKEMELTFKSETWRFTVNELSAQRIVLSPISKNYPYKLTLISLPEPEN